MHAVVRRTLHWLSHAASRLFVLGYVDTCYRPTIVKGSDRLPAPPCVIVSNHGTFFDPWIIGRYSFRPVFYMCNDDAWRAGKVTRTYLDCIGAFPKKKGGVDYKAIKTTLRILDSRSPVCIFPEGQTSWDGETQLIYRGLEKLVKKAGKPVAIYNLCGNFLIKPWWARTKRSGRVLVSVKALTAADVARMSDDDLFTAIRGGIYHNDIKDERNRDARFAGTDLAEGLERLVWICMHCGVEDRLTTAGDTLTCEACGRSWCMDAHCRLQPLTSDTTSLGDLKDWADMQRARVRERVAAARDGDTLTESAGVVMQTLAADGYTFLDRATGRLSLRCAQLAFTPADSSEPTVAVAPSEAKDTVIQKKDIFEFRFGDAYYRFVFNRHSPMKWVCYLRYLNGYAEFEKRGYL